MRAKIAEKFWQLWARASLLHTSKRSNLKRISKLLFYLFKENLMKKKLLILNINFGFFFVGIRTKVVIQLGLKKFHRTMHYVAFLVSERIWKKNMCFHKPKQRFKPIWFTKNPQCCLFNERQKKSAQNTWFLDRLHKKPFGRRVVHYSLAQDKTSASHF